MGLVVLIHLVFARLRLRRPVGSYTHLFLKRDLKTTPFTVAPAAHAQVGVGVGVGVGVPAAARPGRLRRRLDVARPARRAVSGRTVKKFTIQLEWWHDRGPARTIARFEGDILRRTGHLIVWCKRMKESINTFNY